MSGQTIYPDIQNAAAPVQRLTERLASLAPSAAASTFTGAANPPLPRPSPRVAAALARSQAMAATAARRAERSGRSLLGRVIDSFVSACSFIPYAAVALGLRLVMARVFFLSGQDKVDGIRFPLTVHDVDLSVILPLQVKAETISAFMLKYSAVPLPPVLAAYLVSAAEFVLPVCLVLGLATRFAALSLIVMTAVIQFYVLPGALWTAHVYWFAILAVLVSRGAGELSIDHIIRAVSRR